MIHEIKGLIGKDWALMSRQFKFMMVYIVVFIGIFSYTMSDSSFISSFLSIVLFLLSLNCFAYDEQVHFEKLLAASPVTPFRAVLARYLSAFSVGLLGGALITLIHMIVLLLRRSPDTSSILYILAGLAVSVLLMSVMFPLVYKFGVNKSRIMIFIIAGAPALFFVLLSNIIPGETMKPFRLPAGLLDALPFLIPFILAGALAASIALATRIVRNKQH